MAGPETRGRKGPRRAAEARGVSAARFGPTEARGEKGHRAAGGAARRHDERAGQRLGAPGPKQAQDRPEAQGAGSESPQRAVSGRTLRFRGRSARCPDPATKQHGPEIDSDFGDREIILAIAQRASGPQPAGRRPGRAAADPAAVVYRGASAGRLSLAPAA